MDPDRGRSQEEGAGIGPAVWVGAAACIVCAVVFVLLGDPHRAALPAASVLVVWGLCALVTARASGAAGLPAVVTLAVALRGLALLTQPQLSDDVYRYVWEGEVWRAGYNPFVSPPDDPALVGLRDEVWALVNHREVSSIYPPLAQALSVVLSFGGVLAWKVAMGAADVGTAVVLWRRDRRAGLLWALLPLGAVESAGSGHLEGAGVLCMVLALGGRAWAAWAGGMVKLLPGVLLLPLVRRRWWAWIGWAALSVLVAAPILAAGEGAVRGFETYRAIWAYNGSIYLVAKAVLGEEVARRLLQIVGAAASAWILARSRDPGRIAVWVTGAFVILSPTVHPWYVLWPLAAALWNGLGAWEVLAALIPLSYVVLGTYDAAASTWTEPMWPKLVYYPLFFGLLAREGWRRLVLPGPSPV